ncbi:MAG: hypothetical protein ABI780_12030 [Ardenticatenales bacterium]
MARPTHTEPTVRQRIILELVARRVSAGEPSPSLPEMAEAAGFSSNGAVRYAAVSLEALGLLARTDAVDRFYVLTVSGWEKIGLVPPEDAPRPAVSPERVIANAVHEAMAAGEALPDRVVAAALEVAAA